jgi:hypothetical protein
MADKKEEHVSVSGQGQGQAQSSTIASGNGNGVHSRGSAGVRWFDYCFGSAGKIVSQFYHPKVQVEEE